MRTVWTVLLCALPLSGCLLGPNYQRPAIESPQAFIYEPTSAAATADTRWWAQYGDPVLDQLIAEALANNKDVKIAAANVEQAEGVLTQVRAPLYPQLNYQAVARRDRFSKSTTTQLPPGVSDPTSAYAVGAGASWELDLWGRIRRQSQAAKANLLATKEARRGVILSLVADVATGYLQLRGLDEALEIATRTLAAYRKSLAITEDRFAYGQVSQMNVAQVQSESETAAAKIPQIRQQIVAVENALSVLLGRNPETIPRGKTVISLTLPTVPEGVPSQLLQRRPDLVQAEDQLVAANAQIGAAEALYFPTISLTGALGTSSTQLSDLFKGPTGTWSYAGSIVGPIFTAGAISGQVRQAKAGQEAALLSYQRSIQSAFADVEDALSAHRQLTEQVAAQIRLVTSLREYADLAQMLYDGGYQPYSTVLQAQERLFPEELNLAAERAQLLASSVDIYRAMGGGWVDTADRLARSP